MKPTSDIGSFYSETPPPRVRELTSGDRSSIIKAKSAEIAGRMEEMYGKMLDFDTLVKILEVYQTEDKMTDTIKYQGLPILVIKIIFGKKGSTYLHIWKLDHPEDGKKFNG